MNQEMTGAEIVLQSLVDQGVEVVFGLLRLEECDLALGAAAAHTNAVASAS